MTMLWASSWVLIKFGLRNNIPAISFAGLRYSLAWLCLLPFVLYKKEQHLALKQLSRGAWIRLSILGFVFYTLTQGSQFLSLAYLPAAMVSLLLNLTPVLVGIAGIFFLSEQPTKFQWFGIGLAILVVNTAFAFTLWNHTLRTLSAVESSVINSLMMPQIAILALLFLDEALNAKEIWGLALVGVGVLIVQLKPRIK